VSASGNAIGVDAQLACTATHSLSVRSLRLPAQSMANTEQSTTGRDSEEAVETIEMKMTAPTTPVPARTQTDESLRSERSESDRAIAARTKEAETVADDVLQEARDKADAVLENARDEADSKPNGAGPVAQVAQVARRRAVEDGAVEEARDDADVALEDERRQARKILAGMLPIEREKTDRHLLTERARSDAALANRDDFLGMVSHDLRNLLGGIVLEAEMLASEHESAVARARRIQRYTARMNRLIGDLVDVVSIDAGQLALERAPTDLAGVVSQTIDAFEAGAARAGVTLAADCSEALSANVDAERIMQVLANLVGNALKFTPHGGRIVVQGQRVDATLLRLTVHDTGPGIDAHLHEAVFQRFWQNKGDQPGLGLGLYITRSIVEAHGGRIWIESALGKGAAFHVELPAADAA
jgi:signal transduction histidine kinase